MLRSLSVRLTLVLAALFVFLGVVFMVIMGHFSDMYRDEVNQRMNADLAMFIARENRTIGDGAIDLPRLTELLPFVMKVNPAAEVYVLDAHGKVLAFSGPRPPVRSTVDLAPVRAFLSMTQPLPILGTDPRDAGAQRIFSVAALGDAARPSGYVYAVLGSDAAPASALSRGAVLPLAASAFAASLLFALVTGLVLFHSLTGRLRRLADAVDRFRRAPMQAPLPAAAPEAAARHGDEIARLDAAFAALASQIADQLRTLERIDRDRRTALAHASHDLRTPLAALQGYLQTLAVKGASLDEAQRSQYLAVALRHSERLGRLIDQVFALAKLDDPEAQPRRERFSLGELASDIVHKHRLRAEAAGISLHADIDAEAPPVLADIAMFERLIENLVDNALKFTPRGGRVQVGVNCAQSSVVLEVIDSGRGIAAGELPRIFDRFYRGEPASGTSSGLGLAIVKRVAELHGLHLEVSSAPDAGTRVVLQMAADSPGSGESAAIGAAA
jgi:signal transduction histidine kinase